MTTSNILSQLGSAGVSTGFKNRIINGAMVIDQRNAGASVSVNSAGAFYATDRFRLSGAASAGVFTGQQTSTAPVGFVNSLKITTTTSATPASGDSYYVVQNIEGYNVADLNWGTANAKTVTLSFWVYSSLTGTFGGALSNNGVTRSYPFTYSIPVANTWTQISVTVAGDTTGTWTTDNSTGIRVYFSLGTGSTLSGSAGAWAGAQYISATGATSVVGTNGATFYITGVQLEVGTTATNFEYRSIGTELALCQRYFQVPLNVANRLSIGFIYASNSAYGLVPLPIVMRAAPSITFSGTFYGTDASNIGRGMTAGTDVTTVNTIPLNFTSGFNMNAGNATILGLSSSGYVWASAEL